MRPFEINMGVSHPLSMKNEEVRRLTDKKGVELVIVQVGTDAFPKSLSSLAQRGHLVTVGAKI